MSQSLLKAVSHLLKVCILTVFLIKKNNNNNIVTKWILFAQAKVQNGCIEVHAQIAGVAYE